MANQQASAAAIANLLKQLQVSLERIGDACLALNSQLHCIFANESAAMLLGQSKADLMGQSMDIATLPFFTPEVLDLYREAYRTQQQQLLEVPAPQSAQWHVHRIYPDAQGLSVFIETLSGYEQTNKARNEACDNMQRLMDGLPLGMLLADIETRQFVYANQAICQMFGYSPTEFEKLSPIHLHPDYETERVIAAFEGMLEGNTTRLHNLDSVHKNGSIFTVEIDAVLVMYKGRQCISGLFKDVTEQKRLRLLEQQAKAQITASELLMRQAQEVANMGSWEILHADYSIKWSDATYRIFEVDPSIFTPTHHSFMQLVYEEDVPLLDTAFANHIEQRSDFNIVFRIITAHNKLKYVHEKCKTEYDAHGKPLRTVGVVLDITKQKLTELSLKKERQKYQALIEHAPVGIVAIGKEDDLFFTNQKFTQITGYETTDFDSLNDWWQQAYPDESARATAQKKWKQIFTQSRAKKSSANPIESAIVCKDGSSKYVEVGYVYTGEYQLMTLVDITQRKVAEETLAANEAKFRKIAEQMTDVVWIGDLNYKASYVSPSVEKIYGLTVEDFFTTPLEKRFPQHSIDIFKKVHQTLIAELQANAALQSREVTIEIEAFKKDGTPIWIRSSTKILCDENLQPVGIMGVSGDITDRKKAEIALTQSEARYRTLFEGSPVGIVLTNSQNEILLGNSSFTSLTGYDYDDVKNPETWWQQAYPDARYRSVISKEWLKSIEIANTTNCPITSFEALITCKDGKARYFQLGYMPGDDFNIISFTDVHDLRVAQQAIARASENLQNLMSSMPQGVGILDMHSQKYLYVNASLCKMLGYTATELTQLTPLNLHPDYKHDRVVEVIERLENGSEEAPLLFDTITKAGNMLQVEISPLFVEYNGEKAIAGVFTDVTEKIQASRALQLAKDKAEENELLLKQAQHIALMGSWTLDYVQDQLQWSDSIFEILGLIPDSVTPTYKLYQSFVHPDDKQLLDDAFQNHVHNHQPYEIRHRIILHNGTVKHINASAITNYNLETGKPLYTIGIMTDVTKQVLTEKALVEAKEKAEARELILKQVQKIGLSGHWEHNHISNYITWSEDVFNIFGLDASGEALSYEDFFKALPTEDAIRVDKVYQQHLKEKTPFDIIHRIITPSGEIKYVQQRCQTFYDEAGKAIKSIGAVADITEAQKATAEIQAQKDYIQSLLEAIPYLLFALDENDCFTTFKSAREDNLMLPPEAFIGKNYKDVLPEYLAREFEPMLAHVRNGEQTDSWQYSITLGGEVKHFEAKLQLMHNNSVLILSRDVTTQKKTALLLEESEQKYKLVFEAISVGLVAMDDKGSVLLINKAMTKLTGYIHAEIPGIEDWWRIAYPDEAYRKHIRTAWETALQQAVSTQTKMPPFEATIYCKNGSSRFFEIGFEQAGNISLISYNDIHERKIAQLELAASENRFRQIAETVEEVFWLRSADIKELLYINPAYEKVFGRSIEELYKEEKFILKAIHPDDAAIVISGYHEYLQSFQFDMEYRIVLPTGEVRWIRNKSLPVKDNEGNIVAHAGIAEDITERKSAIIRLQEQEAFQHLLVMLATEFINSPTNQFDELMNSMLEKVGRATNTDRVYIFENDDVLKTSSNTYEWCAEGISKEKNNLQHQSYELFSDILNAHKAGKVYHIPDIESIKQNLVYYNHLRAQNIKSLVIFPLIHNTNLIGFIGFDAVKEARTFTETEIQLLQVLAEIVTNGMLRKKAETLLRENETRLVELTSQSRTIAWETDTDGKYTYVSNVVSLVLGYTPDELIGKMHYCDLHPEKNRAHFIETTQKILHSNASFHEYEHKAVHKNGQLVWLATSGMPITNEAGELIGFRGGDTDITNRKTMELAVVKSEASYRLLAENSTDVIWIYDIGKHALKYVSPSCIELHGYTVAETLRLPIEDTMTASSYSLVMQIIKENIELYQSTGSIPRSQMLELQQYHKNGTIVWVETVAKLQLNADNELEVLGVSRNITERKKAELEKQVSQEALKESESRLEAIIETTSDNIWSVNNQYEILYINAVFRDAFEKSFGVRLQKGDNILTKLPTQLKAMWQAHYDYVLQNKSRNSFEEQYEFPTGQMWVEVTMFPIIANDEAVGVSCFGKDITTQKISELALAESEQRFRSMFNDNASIMLLIDVDTYNIIDINPAAEKFYGWTAENFKQLKITDICLHPEKAKHSIQTACAEKNVRFEIVHRLSNGTLCEMEVFGSLLSINGKLIIHEIIHDVSAKKRAEADLIEKNKQLNLLIQSIPGVVFNCYNNEDNRMNFINDYIQEITGYTAAEINNNNTIHYRMLIHPEDIPKFDIAVEDAYAHKSMYNFSYRLLNKDGSYRWVYEIGEFQSYEGPSKDKRIDGIIFDITNRITNEEMKLSAAYDAAEAERTRISHEIHDGIQQTLVASKLMISSIRKDIDQLGGRLLEKYNNGIDLLDQGITEARSIAHSLMPKQVNEYGYVVAVEHLIANLDKKIEVEFNHPDLMLNDGKFGTNLFRITQEAINNIIKHAAATKIIITLSEAGNRLILTIQDNGVGFDKRQINSPENGIGLQIMASRAAVLNAYFDVATAPGIGTTIIVDVPYE
ncbi:MAG: PAS domain S-box protein [Bacteroidetes bacterium]|uniref:PAS domain S-box protein n=1 Tax=Phnomibacter sp. TaxID=2836217 RepID=UPI002FDE2307|nr:PAS domain S-box protein [Bacteroidota bacterium]